MLSNLLRVLFRDEVEELQRRSAGVGLEVQGGVILLAGLLFAMIGLFLWLAEGRPAWQAALIVAALLLALGAAVFLYGRSKLRRQTVESRRVRTAEMDRLAQPLYGKGGDLDPDNLPPSVVPTALVIGIAIGRFLRR